MNLYVNNERAIYFISAQIKNVIMKIKAISFVGLFAKNLTVAWMGQKGQSS